MFKISPKKFSFKQVKQVFGAFKRLFENQKLEKKSTILQKKVCKKKILIFCFSSNFFSAKIIVQFFYVTMNANLPKL